MPKLIINGKEIRGKETAVITRKDGTVEIIIEKKPEDKKKKEEDLKEFKFQCKRSLLEEIGRLFRRISDHAKEIDVQEFVATNGLIPMDREITYGITVNKEKQEAMMINPLFNGFKEIDNLKGKDIPKVEAILKQVRDNIDAFTKKKEEEKEKIHPQLKEDLKHNCEVKARQVGKTQEMKDCIFSGIDFGKAYNVGRGLKVSIKNGQPYIEEI